MSERVGGMRCEVCGIPAHITDSRGRSDGSVRRRRECRRCRSRFTTREVREETFQTLTNKASMGGVVLAALRAMGEGDD